MVVLSLVADGVDEITETRNARLQQNEVNAKACGCSQRLELQ